MFLKGKDSQYAGTIFQESACFSLDDFHEAVFKAKMEAFLKQESLSVSTNKVKINNLKVAYSLPETTPRRNARIKATLEYQSHKVFVFQVLVCGGIISCGFVLWELSKSF